MEEIHNLQSISQTNWSSRDFPLCSRHLARAQQQTLHQVAFLFPLPESQPYALKIDFTPIWDEWAFLNVYDMLKKKKKTSKGKIWLTKYLLIYSWSSEVITFVPCFRTKRADFNTYLRPTAQHSRVKGYHSCWMDKPHTVAFSRRHKNTKAHRSVRSKRLP